MQKKYQPLSTSLFTNLLPTPFFGEVSSIIKVPFVGKPPAPGLFGVLGEDGPTRWLLDGLWNVARTGLLPSVDLNCEGGLANNWANRLASTIMQEPYMKMTRWKISGFFFKQWGKEVEVYIILISFFFFFHRICIDFKSYIYGQNKFVLYQEDPNDFHAWM